MKKWLIALCFTMATLTFTGTDIFAQTSSSVPTHPSELTKHTRYTPTHSANSRPTLTPENTKESSTARATFSLPVVEDETELSDFLLDNMRSYETVFEAYYYGDMETLLDDMEAIILTDEYVFGVAIEYGFSYEDELVTFEVTYATSAEQQEAIDQEVVRILSVIVNPDMSDVEKVLAINSYVVRNTDYSFNSKASPHSAYAIVSEGLGVCQAYAMLAYQLYLQAGLEAHYVTGFAGEDHAWNLVKVDGEWYHIDSTWNDPGTEFENIDASDYISYEYFLVSEKTLVAEDRTIEQRPQLPRATSERFALVRQATSSEYTYDDIPFLLSPEFASGFLFFIELEEESYAIKAIDLKKKRLKIERVTDTPALELFTTNEALYFTNIDTGLGLSKYVFETDEIEDLYADEPVTTIRYEDGSVIAYNYDEAVYAEEVAAIDKEDDEETGSPVTEGANQLLTKINDLLEEIDYHRSDFAELAAQLLYYVDEMPYTLDSVLSSSDIEKINEIRALYNENEQPAPPTDANVWDEQVTDDAEKIWRITLSHDILNTRANRSKIKLFDLYGEEVKTKINISGKTISIEATSLYETGIQYTIVIEKGFESKRGKQFEKDTYIPFYVED